MEPTKTEIVVGAVGLLVSGAAFIGLGIYVTIMMMLGA